MDNFPVLPGLTWSITRTPKFATRVQTATSGRELRVADQVYPIWTWTLIYNFLRDGNDTTFGPNALSLGTGYQELRTLMGFYVRQQGQFGVWLYDDPSDDSVTNGTIGTGDGTTTTFQLFRTLSAPSYGGLFTEPVTQPNEITSVFVNGVAVYYQLQPNGIVSIPSPPPAGAPITATFTYSWPCRFAEDSAEFENFLFGLWSMKKLTFQSVLLP